MGNPARAEAADDRLRSELLVTNIEVVVGVEPSESLTRRTDAEPVREFEAGPRLPFGNRHAVRIDEDPDNALPLCGYRGDPLFVMENRPWAGEYRPADHHFCGSCASLFEELTKP